jgi:hypothetical protein
MILFAALALAGLVSAPAAAHYSEPCWVKFRIDFPSSYRNRAAYYSDAPANVYAVTCNYLTGTELNARAGYKRFNTRSVYVAIVWPYSNPSYIRVSQSLPLCGDVTEPDCAERIAGRLTGSDDYYDRRGRVYRRSWDICQPGFLDRDCYRMLGGYRG